jgi:hypothetical protein
MGGARRGSLLALRHEMLVYRSTQHRESCELARDELQAALASDQRALEALLRAGELECALADADHPDARTAEAITDALAARYLDETACDASKLAAQLAGIALPEALALKIPEGYAYYALSPAAYAELARSLHRPRAAVIGVRSIGTSLSAVVKIALRGERISVRPSGEPWARELRWSDAQRAFVERLQRTAAEFLIVDEGPGMSGSTFLAVAEALERCGVDPGRIRILCSHPPQPEQLLASDARARCARYRWHSIDPWRAPPGSRDVSAGAWRALLYSDAEDWPACWPQRERVKCVSADGQWLDKFEGMPPYGTPALERAQRLQRLGVGPTAAAMSGGFVRFGMLRGRPARASDLDAARLQQLARYCALRAREFAVSEASVNARELRELLACNLHEAFGVELGERLPLELRMPVIADARMQPHEWIAGQEPALQKTDGHGHGDDHLLPGPCDIAWDVAGALIEWRMDRARRERFIELYARESGDGIAARLPPYEAAYCALRLGELTYAAVSCDGDDRRRARVAADYYRRCLARVARAAAGWPASAAKLLARACSGADQKRPAAAERGELPR